MDKSALDGIPTSERRRQEVSEHVAAWDVLFNYFTQAIFELIATEVTYVRDLQLIVEVRTRCEVERRWGLTR